MATNADNTAEVVGGVIGGICALLILVALVLFFIYLKLKNEKKVKDPSSEATLGFELNPSQQAPFARNPDAPDIGEAERTLLNTRMEVALPGFLMLNFIAQNRKEEKIGGGGCAIIYKGVILDDSLKKKHGFEAVGIKEVFDDPNIAADDLTARFQQLDIQ